MSHNSEADCFEESLSPAEPGGPAEDEDKPPCRPEGPLQPSETAALREDLPAGTGTERFVPAASAGEEPLALLQAAVDRLTTALEVLEERLDNLSRDSGKPKEAPVEILLPQSGAVVEVPIKLRVETEDSRQLALLQELHAQRERLQEELAAAHRQIERLGKTQFKSTHVMEAMHKSAEETVTELRAALEARDRELAELRNLAEEVRKEYRLHLAQELLRIADGLERSQEEADRLRASLDEGLAALRPQGWWGRWWERRAKQIGALLRERQADLASWQEGLSFVQQRLSALLADAGVEPVPAVGRPFDPHRQVAVGRVSDPGQPDNYVVEEHLKGYIMGDRVLRFAEVVVNRVDSREDSTTRT